MSGWRQSWQRIVAEWRDNPRLRVGVLVVGLILAAWLVLALGDRKVALAGAYADDVVHLRKMQALSGQTVWIERAAAAKRLEEALAVQIPDARTAGLAQAAFQTQLGAMTQKFAGAVKVQVSPANSDTGKAGIWRVPATLDGELGMVQIEQFVAELESRPNLITIERLSITNRDKVRFSATVQAYYRVPTPEAAHAP